MNHTLLGLAIALIVALATAMAAPLFVDWTQHRAWFASQLSTLLGARVQINGTIDATLLPTPRFAANRITIGAADGGLIIDRVQATLALGPLLRGEIKAEEIALTRPVALISLAADGSLSGPLPTTLPEASAERLIIRDAHLTINAPAAARTTTLSAIDLAGEWRTSGALRMEGRAAVAGTPTGVKLSLAPLPTEGNRLRLSLDPERGPQLEVDGTLTVDRGVPRFAGQVVASQGMPAPLERLKATASVLVDPNAAQIDTLALRVGTDDKGLALDGSARLTLGRAPLLDVVLGGKQIDIDRLIGTDSNGSGAPLAVLRSLASAFGDMAWMPSAARVGISAETILLGGDTVRDLRADLTTRDTGWSIDFAEARLPGRGTVRFSGAPDGPRAAFRGLATLDVAEPQSLLRWLDGTGAIPRTARGEPLKLEARLDVTPDALTIDALKVDSATARLAGRIDWRRRMDGQAETPSLDITLSGSGLDVDGLRAAMQALDVMPADMRPARVMLELSLGGMRFAGLTARALELRARYAADTADIARIALSEFGGLSIEGRGRLSGLTSDVAPSGRMSFDVAAQSSDGLSAALQIVLPSLGANIAKRMATAMAPSRLTIGLAADDGNELTTVARGSLPGGTLDLRADVPMRAPHTTRATMRLDTSDGERLLSAIGVPTSAHGPGRLHLDWSGARDGGVGALKANLSAPGIELQAAGTIVVPADTDAAAIRPDIAVTASRIDLAALGLSPTRAPLSASGSLRLRWAENALLLEAIDARLGNAPVKGDLRLIDGGVAGALRTDQVFAEALVKALAGASGTAVGWSGESFGAAALSGAIPLDVTVATPRLGLVGDVVVEDAAMRLRTSTNGGEVLLESGRLAGGRVQGRLACVRGDSAVAINARGQVSDADIDALTSSGFAMPAGTRPSGRLGLEFEIAGSGRSPVAVVAAMAGHGTLRLAPLSWPGLSPAVFEALAKLSQESAAPDERRVATVAATTLASGPLTASQIEVPLSIAGGQVRTGAVVADFGTARGNGALALDLTRLALKASLELGPKTARLPGAPDLGIRWEGPLGAAERRLDVTALVTSLSLAAVERETKLLEERDLRRRLPPPPDPAPVVLSPPPPPPPPPPPQPSLRPVQPRPPAAMPSTVRAPDLAPGLVQPLPPPLEIGPPVGSVRRPLAP